jgi:predicted nucleic acid-binding protein
VVREGGAISVLSVQVLNELANVARQEMRLSWPETRAFLSLLRGLLIVHPLDLPTG